MSWYVTPVRWMDYLGKGEVWMSFICHIHNYTEYNEEWNAFSAFNPSKCTHLEQWAADCAAPGEQSWTSCRSRDSNPQPWVTSGFKSNALSIRPTTALYFVLYFLYCRKKKTNFSIDVLICHTCEVDGLSRQRRSAHKHRFRQICEQYLREIGFLST